MFLFSMKDSFHAWPQGIQASIQNGSRSFQSIEIWVKVIQKNLIKQVWGQGHLKQSNQTEFGMVMEEIYYKK